jgi:hypothetical protein
MERRFDEREVSLILRRAAEVARDERPATIAAGGMTLAEIKEIAAEVGIDPSRVDTVARSIDTPARRSRLDVFVGSPTNVRHDAVFAAALSEEDRGEAVRRIRDALGTPGVVGGRADSVEWMDQDGLGGRYVTLAPAEGGTRVEVSGAFREAAAGAAGIAGVVGAVGSVATGLVVAAAGPVGWVLAPLTLGAMFAVPRLTIGAVVRRETRKLGALHDRLRDLVSTRERDREDRDPNEEEDA